MKDPQLKKKLAEILDPNVDPSTLSTKADWVHPELKDFKDGTKEMSEMIETMEDGEPIPEEFLPVIARLVSAMFPEIGELSDEEQQIIANKLKSDGLVIPERLS